MRSSHIHNPLQKDTCFENESLQLTETDTLAEIFMEIFESFRHLLYQ